MAISITEVKKNPKLKNEFIKENINLVKKVMFDKFTDLYASEQYEDILQEGLLGLSLAIDRFDTNKGNKFSTLAYIYIFGYIKQFLRIDYNAGLKIPVTVNIEYKKAKALLNEGKKIEDIKKEMTVSKELEDLLFKHYLIDNVVNFKNDSDDEKYDVFDSVENNYGIPTNIINDFEINDKLSILAEIFSENASKIIQERMDGIKSYSSISKKFNISEKEIRNHLNHLRKYYFLVERCYNGEITIEQAKKIYVESSKPGKKNKTLFKEDIYMSKPKKKNTVRERISHDEAVSRLYKWALKNPGKYINKESLGNVVITDCNFSNVKEDTIKVLRSNGYNVEQMGNSYKLICNESPIATDEELAIIEDIPSKEIETESNNEPNVKYKDIQEMLDTIVNLFSNKYDSMMSGESCFNLQNEILDVNNIDNILQIVKSMVVLSNSNNKKIRASIQLVEE